MLLSFFFHHEYLSSRTWRRHWPALGYEPPEVGLEGVGPDRPEVARALRHRRRRRRRLGFWVGGLAEAVEGAPQVSKKLACGCGCQSKDPAFWPNIVKENLCIFSVYSMN
jgi:hypothetical protein